MSEYILSQGYGYGYAVGLGALFCFIMLTITKLLTKYMGQVQNSERFSTAARSVNSGLIASATVSSWTWPATLLSSSTWSYSHGISGSYLYGVGGTIQIILFVLLALEMKRIAPGVHTIAELVRVRFGKTGHWVYLCYCVVTNILVSSLLLLGGSQGFESTCGMHIVAASFLLPLGVCIYTLFGGLHATFLSDWIHTVIIYMIICIMCFVTYGSSSIIGSIDKMYDMLEAVQEKFPNATGKNYLSFDDPQMIMLTWSVMIGGLSSVFGDPSYGQKAIAADAKGIFMGYVLGGVCWLVVPWALGTSAGLTARALLLNPASFTYPNELTDDEVSAGLPAIYAMGSILGKSGAAAGLLMLFMSVTSATSAELIAFSSVATYDIYRSYIKPDATGKELIRFTHLAVIGFSLFMAAISIVFNYIGVTVGWLLSFTGIILSPEVFAITMTLFWKKMSKWALIIGCPLGTLSGVACWLGTTAAYNNNLLDKDTLATNPASLVGNLVSLFSAPIYFVIISYLKPDEEPFDFTVYETAFIAGDDADTEEKAAMKVSDEEKRKLKRLSYVCIVLNVILLFGAYIILPVSYLGTGYTFSKPYFRQWIIIMMIWLVIAAAYIVIMPLYQGRHVMKELVNAIFKGRETEYQQSLHTTTTTHLDSMTSSNSGDKNVQAETHKDLANVKVRSVEA
ncbi:hypothetical protein PACTADRAFT_50838 [Pachysolen tannophilus NRRL Y-2460]|uniref:Urea active transporter n=1 Tax=Pachysolen tannophilus NRRL Y-2460 TaxID=669874 RepID=A0A1E4TTD3_PACTA|nr:hypothetical protein PACTADRAFT_50838 [Pachysolen tannophilus NRRL Y-2460]